ncbi:RNA dependent RNA polymerase-domain-containing protein [Lentinula raphanica]|nr:RNA dependent RNA polymerase-domain-containing protein [Lentinula raphanica]
MWTYLKASLIARKKRVVFQARNYTPCVYQIRYKGYKGVVMIHPDMDQEKKHLIEFRKSMKKFKSTIDDTFAVVGYSTPYSFGRLNNDIVVLCSSLGITNEVFLAKQEAYFNWIEQATSDVIKGFEFLASQGPKYFEDANRLVLDGFTPDLLRTIRGAQNSELAAFKKNDDLKKERVRMLVHKSRRLYGVCDPHRILREGEVHVRVMTSRNGCSTIIGTDVIVVRNPCLHPGDILKLRAVDKPELSHLVDCVVFASQGKRSPTAMSSGGDLDGEPTLVSASSLSDIRHEGDEYFVCWDPDIVPSRVFESYDYPPNKEITQKTITRQDLARYFAAYNSSGMAQTSALHNKWARYHPQGAMSPQCQELNALYSQAVDGAHVKIPERLRKPPEPPEGSRFVLTELFQAAQTWSQGFLVRQGVAESASVSVDEADELIKRLFSVSESTVSEYKLLELARRIARKHDINFRPYLSYINYGALQTHEKYELAQTMEMSPEEEAYMWNSLLRSDIVSPKELTDKKLSGPLRVQRLYSSKDVGIHAFFGYLVRAMQNFTRKLVIFKLDDRFSFVIFMRGEIPLNEDFPVDGEHIVVATFMQESALEAIPTFTSCTTGFQLYCGDGNLQLFNKHRANTFIHIRKPPVNSNEAFITSIALQQISARVQRQMGRINRTPVASVEIHVVSNRDRIAHELFDLRFDHVTTEEFLKRFAHVDKTYLPNTLQDVDLDSLPEPLRVVFAEPANETRVKRLLSMEHITTQVLDQCADFAWIHHADHQLFWIFDTILNLQPMNQGLVLKWLDTQPLLVFCILKKFIADESNSLPAPWTALGPTIVQHIIRAAYAVPIAALYALEKLKTTVAAIEFHNYLEILELAMISIRAPQQIIETLMVLHECREAVRAESPAKEYAHKQALAVAVDRAQEAADVCPCDEDGKIKRQRSAPAVVPLFAVEGDVFNVVAHIRVDSPTTIRLHSHVRFRAASKPEKGVMDSDILDGLVTLSESGEIRVKLVHRPPPEFERMEWYLYDVGSVATFRAMVDAIRRLALEGPECCRFSRMITDAFPEDDDGDDAGVIEDVAAISAPIDANDLNESQYEAIRRTRQAQVSLIWGPPGTGKTTVVVQVLRDLIQNLAEGSKILMTASTHNAVDNVLERFVRLNDSINIVPTDKIIRFATDSFRVGKSVKSFTVESRVGGEIVRDSRRREKAERLIRESTIIFTTCASAGLGALRTIDFDIALIDEASQITEPVGLIPLVKGCKKAVLVGDHFDRWSEH